MASETVRIKADTHAKLKALSKKSGRSMPEILAIAIESLYRDRFLADADRAYAKLRSDPLAWKEEQAERQAWDVTLDDGLEQEPDEPSPKRRRVSGRSKPHKRS